MSGMNRLFLSIVSVVFYSCCQVLAAESRPVVENLPQLKCNEWKVDVGHEGGCVYRTVNGDWEVGYTRMGNEKRSLKYKLKNLVVLFHPSGSSHKMQEWWGPMIGKGKPLDPNRHVFLSVGMVGDQSPKVGSPKKLDINVILDAAQAVVDQLYPSSEFYVGGVSGGGNVAYLLSQRLPGRTKGVFMVSAVGIPTANESRIFQDNLNALSMGELSSGPYSEWSEDLKKKFWKDTVSKTIDLYYTDQFFTMPESMVELGKDKSEYKDKNSLRSEIIDSWVFWSAKTADMPWSEAQSRSIIDGTKQAYEGFSKVKLPKNFLMIHAKEDKLFLPAEYDAFASLLTQKKKNVTRVVLEDPRGHMSCCSSTFAPQLQEALAKFIDD